LSVFEDKYKRESSKYESQVLFWQNEIQKYNDSGDAALRKHKEYEAQIATFRGTIADYEGRLRNKDASFEEFNYKETQLQQEIARLKSQVSLLTQEIERINEFSQKK
jgi:chromosome segregation ATPase